MASDGQIVINTKLNDHGLKQGITGLQDTTITALNKVKGVLATVGIGVGVAAAVKGINNLIKSTAEYTDRIDKQSQKIGMSKRGYQEWDFILSDLGANVDGLQLGLKTLSSAMDEANRGNKEYGEMFKRLGVNIKDTNGNLKDQETIFNEVFDALAGMESQTERTAIASRLLGRSATELAPALNAGADEIEFLKNRAYELNTVLDDTTIAIGVNFGDQVGRMKRALQTASARAIAPFMDDLADLATSFSDNVIPAIEKFMSTAFKVGLSIPPIFQFVKAVVTTVLKEIGEALDGPWTKLKEFLADLVNLPIVKNTIEFIMKLGGDLWEGLKAGVKTGDWSKFWTASLGVAKFALQVATALIPAIGIASALWTGIQTALFSGGFSKSLGGAGTIAMLSVGVKLLEAIEDGGWGEFAINMGGAIAGGLSAGWLTKSPKVGVWVASILLNFDVGSGLVDQIKKIFAKPDQLIGIWVKEVNDELNKSLRADQRAVERVKVAGILGEVTWGTPFGDSAHQKKAMALLEGTELGKAIAEGLDIGLGDPSNISNDYAKAIINAFADLFEIRSPSKVFKRIGTEIVNGLESGLEGMVDAGKEGAQEFLDSVQDTLGVHSESKEGHWIGNEFVNGIINGLIEMFPELKAEAEKMRDALAKIWTEQPATPPTGGGGGGTASPVKLTFGQQLGGIWDDVVKGWKAAREEMSADINDWATWATAKFMNIGATLGNALGAGIRSLGQSIATQRQTIEELGDSIKDIEDSLEYAYEDLTDAQDEYADAVLSGDSDAIKTTARRLKQQQALVDGYEEQLAALREEKKSVEDGSKAWKDFAKTILGALADTLYGLGAELAARAILAALTFNWPGAAAATAGSAVAFGAAIALDAWAGSFAEGGIVPQVSGIPTSGDKHVASVNPGELILNAAQQQNVAAQLAMLSRLTELIASINVNSHSIVVNMSGATINGLDEEKVGRAIYRNIKTLQREGVLGTW